MVASSICPRCQKRFRGENHVCQPSAIAKLRPAAEAQRRFAQAKR